MDVRDLKGRNIEDVPYSGLVESLSGVIWFWTVTGGLHADRS